MDYADLASRLLREWAAMHRITFRRKMDSFVQGEKMVLNYLAEKDAPALPSDLSSDMGMTSARTAAVLGSLERKELVTRRRDQQDRRRVRVELTARGRAEVLAERVRLHAMLEQLLRELGEQDAGEFLRILRRIVDISGRCASLQEG